jgi:hypothetical protein
VTAETSVVDLRQYTLVPGARDTLIDLFDQHFVESQEAVGIHVIGQFRDLDDPDRFVWLRGFDSLAARGEALPRFYHGPVWQEHRERANATMLDSDDALLLEPIHLGPAYPRYGAPRLDAPAQSVVAVIVAYLAGPITAADRSLADEARACLAESGADVVAMFTTHAAENNFPALPLRDEHVLVWIARCPDDAGYGRYRRTLDASAAWARALDRLGERSNRLPMQQLRLRPTNRSQLR